MSPDVRQALELWLEYAETRRTLVARLFVERDDAERIRELLDENDRRLDEAVRLTRQLLQDPECG